MKFFYLELLNQELNVDLASLLPLAMSLWVWKKVRDMFPNIFVPIYFRSAQSMQLNIRTLGNTCDHVNFDKLNVV